MTMSFVAAMIASYLLGSIPWAHIAGKSKGIDLRKHGSGNLGATNVLRVLGTKMGILVFMLDMTKGALPALLFPRLLPAAGMPLGNPVVAGILCGIAAIAGHVRPVYLGFGRGGKGVATAAGVFLALAPIQTVLALVVFTVVLLSSGYVSLASLIAAAILPVLLGIGVGVRSPIFAISIIVTTFVYWTHRANIRRLRSGEEHRFGKRGVPARRSAVALAIASTVVLAVAIAARFV